MSNNLTLADAINAALDTGRDATFIYNSTTYTFSPAGLLAFLAAENALLAGVTASVAELNTLDGVTANVDELNILDGVTSTTAELNSVDGIGVTVTIGIAASATTDGMDITITVKDAAGATVAAVHQLEIWMSEAATGIGLTADAYSGDLTATTGAILSEHTAKKHWSVVTAATGIFTATLVDSANPVDQYVVAKRPLGAGVVVSAASGVNWEGV